MRDTHESEGFVIKIFHENLPPEPEGAWVRGSLSAHIELTEEGAERFAGAVLDESDLTPAMIALFEIYE